MQLQTLDCLPLCREAYITDLGTEGDPRRRLLDLGFSPGSAVTPLFRSPLGDPTAYHVADTVIALRRADAEKIRVQPARKEAR